VPRAGLKSLSKLQTQGNFEQKMDKTDMSLIMLLAANSRSSYSELAEKLNLSVNAVHKRIQLLIEADVIRKFTAKISLQSLMAIVVFVSGTSQLDSLQDLSAKLETHGSIYWLVQGGGKFLCVGAYLKTLNDLGGLIEFVKKEAGLLEPTVRIAQTVPMSEHRIMTSVPLKSAPKTDQANLNLYDLDYKIIRSLKDNSRKTVSEVAIEVGASAKTVRRRIMRMIKNNLIELGLEWYPDKSNDIITLIDLQAKPNEKIGSIAYNILRKYAPNVLFYWSFVNTPNLVTLTVWTNSMNELASLRENLEKEQGVASIAFNILYKGYIFDTWRDKLLEKY
jgi:DNA-binding Lrp family transcriptional regulator